MRRVRQQYPQYIAPGTGTGTRHLGEPLHWVMAPPSPTTWQLIGQLSTIGMSFVFALVLGFGGGYWLDGALGTRPWISFVGFFVGLAAGVLNVYRVMQIASRK